TPHPLFGDLYRRVHVALDEAELCLHAEVTSRPNVLEVFFEFETWGRFVAARQAQVHRALEAEIEAHRSQRGYQDDERIVLRLFVADPAQLDVHPDHPEVIARRVPDPFALEERWQSSLKHTTVVGGPLPPPPFPSTIVPPPAIVVETKPTPLAVLEFT